MFKTSIAFCGIAFVCLFLGDFQITTSNPWEELGRMVGGVFQPDIRVIYEIKTALLNTFIFAFVGISVGIVVGVIFALLFQFTVVRLFCAFIRAIHEIFWAFIFLPLVGLNPICGILAIAVPYSGIFGKVFAEIIQEADRKPLDSLPFDSPPFSKLIYGILPVVYADIKQYTAYRLECALRSSAVLGFVGLPTLGFFLETAFREGEYSQVAAILMAFYILIASLRYWIKPKLVPIYIVASFFLISKEVSISLENITRFLTYEILPWPMRREGFLDGSFSIEFPLAKMGEWFGLIFREEIFPGVWNTLLLTQVALVGSALFALVGFPMISRKLHGTFVRAIFHAILVVGRTTPEYILAYIFLQLWGPSMLPAIVALSLHNGAILAFLSGRNSNLVKLAVDAPVRRLDRYFFVILPRIYGQFMAFLFYRWEIIMRESSILGIIGIFTLGFYVDSGMAEDRLDKAMLLILATALFNMGIDTISYQIRKRLKISVKQVTMD